MSANAHDGRDGLKGLPKEGISMRRLVVPALIVALLGPSPAHAQKYVGADGRLRVALAKQPFLPSGTSPGPNTMAEGGIQALLARMGALVKVDEAGLTPDENTEYGGWKRLGMALGHFADIVAKNERDGFSRSACWRPVPRCRGSSPGCSIRDRRARPSGSACCGSTRIRT
jgi:hypothetical protein